MTHKRGMLTDRIKEKSSSLLGYEITQAELRLLPYIQCVMTNEQKIEPAKIDVEERRILSKWRKDGHLAGGAGGLQITKEFWVIMCELIFLGYVDIDD